MSLVTLLLLFLSTSAFSFEEFDCANERFSDEQCQEQAIEQTEDMIAKYQAHNKENEEYLADTSASDCKNAITTNDINICHYREVKMSEIEMTQYLLASLDRLKTYPKMSEYIDDAQQSWLNYRDKECDAVYQQWIDGTIRGAMAIECKLQLTKERTHAIWRSYLTYMDSTPPVLPEPNHD